MSLSSNRGDEIVDNDPGGEIARTAAGRMNPDAASLMYLKLAEAEREERFAQALADSQDAAAAHMLAGMKPDARRG